MYSLRSSAQRLPSGIYIRFKTPVLQNANDLTSHENTKEGYLFGWLWRTSICFQRQVQWNVTPRSGCCHLGRRQMTPHDAESPHKLRTARPQQVLWAQSNPPRLRKALLSASASSPAQHRQRPTRASALTQSTCARVVPSSCQKAFVLRWRNLQLPRKFCTDVPKPQQLLISQPFFYFCLCKERCETAAGAQAPNQVNLCFGVAALQAPQVWFWGLQFAASYALRQHVLSHDCWEVTPKMNDSDTHSRFIHLWTLFQPNGEAAKRTNGSFFFHKRKFYSKFLKK